MRRPTLLLLLAAAGAALAQQAAAPAVAVEHFHDAARLYVAGDTVEAAREARAGLAAAPGDPALTALLAEILRRPPPQPPSGGGDRPPPQPPPRDPESEQDGDGGDEGAEEPTRGRGEDRRDRRDDGAEPSAPRPGTADPASNDDTGRRARDPGGMTREEAEALLRALGADERRLLRARQREANPPRFENDW